MLFSVLPNLADVIQQKLKISDNNLEVRSIWNLLSIQTSFILRKRKTFFVKKIKFTNLPTCYFF